jgi:hypothetical protein
MSTASFAIAQENSASPKKTAVNPDIYTSIRPADGNPAVFHNKQELESKVQFKKDNIIEMIKQNASDTAKVRFLRQELWRFENATVIKAN